MGVPQYNCTLQLQNILTSCEFAMLAYIESICIHVHYILKNNPVTALKLEL